MFAWKIELIKVQDIKMAFFAREKQIAKVRLHCKMPWRKELYSYYLDEIIFVYTENRFENLIFAK